MSAFFIVQFTIKDAAKFQEYAQQAGPTMATHGGELLFRGNQASVLAGENPHPAIAFVQFPDMDRLNRWYHSEEYQALVPLRDEAADMILTGYEVA